MKSKKSTRTMIILPDEVKDKLWALAEKEGRSLSNMIRMIIEKYLKSLDQE